MAYEIERKFRITKIDKHLLKHGTIIQQGYLCFSPEIRVRLKGCKGFITIKSEGSVLRNEFEYSIPLTEARMLLKMCPYKLTKIRYKYKGFEIDIFRGNLRNLIIIEKELKEINCKVSLPPGINGYEVSFDKRYKNKNLVRRTNILGL